MKLIIKKTCISALLVEYFFQQYLLVEYFSVFDSEYLNIGSIAYYIKMDPNRCK